MSIDDKDLGRALNTALQQTVNELLALNIELKAHLMVRDKSIKELNGALDLAKKELESFLKDKTKAEEASANADTV